MLSLKIKLVAYFLVLSLLPVAAGYWGFASSLAGNERRRADERLTAELRATSAAYREQLAAARDEARRLASRLALQQALHRRNGRAIERLLAGRSTLHVVADGRTYGAVVAGAHAATITVSSATGELGRVVATVPIDAQLAAILTRRAGLADTDRLLLATDGIVRNGFASGRPLADPTGTSATLDLGGAAYRIAAAGSELGAGDVTLAVVTANAAIDAAVADARRQLLLGVLGSLLLIALVAYGEGVTIVRTIRRFVTAAQAIARGRLDERVPVRTRDEFGQLGHAFNDMADELEQQRNRLHRATLRFGEALAATHDIDQLLRVIVTTAVESTSAEGGVIRGDTEIAQAGTIDEMAEQIAVPLAVGGESFGTLILYGHAFEPGDHDVVASLAAHAVTALENARLHQIVKRQALLDSLTNMPNRRQCESALATELSQARRFGTSVAFVLADLDGFKAVNDRHGHPAGDRVLREFADILRECVRDADLAARWGGEEFALVLPSTDSPGAAVLVERIRSTLEHRTIIVDGAEIAITASFGVAIFPDETDPTRLIASADEALYVAKRRGKNRVETALPLPILS